MASEEQDRKLHTVKPDEEYISRIKKHRRRVRAVVIALVLIVLIAGGAFATYVFTMEYTEYDVMKSGERLDADGSSYVCFADGLLKYNYDGAMYTDKAGIMLWNQTYEMENPNVFVSDSYAVIYEVGGKEFYIMSTVAQTAAVTTTVPLLRATVASNGTAAVLLEENGTSCIQLYNSAGKQLAAGELHMENSGFPLDISISENGELLAVSILNINEATQKTIITFYNFGSVGQSEIDNIVASYTFTGYVIPRIKFMAGDFLVAFSPEEVLIFSGSKKPVEQNRIKLLDKPVAIFYNNEYFGISYDDRIEVYSPQKSRVMELNGDFDDCDIRLLSTNELAVVDEDHVDIYSISGKLKFSADAKDRIYMVLPGKTWFRYSFVLPKETQEVRLRWKVQD
ncbi:MAG: DUF5711 family protein [Lachnospiraceae bacterium]|nr:DUF5711 family protein [Lachnospiraceae bacterium]